MSKKAEKNIIAFVANLPQSSVESIHAYGKKTGQKFRIMLILDKKHTELKREPQCDILLKIDFSKSEKITEALLPYENQLLAITCRSEANIARFAKIIPCVPYLRTPTSESLSWATDKYEMRKRFKLYDPKITPKFTLVKDTSVAESKRLIEKIGFPMIIKPANLAASLFVTICYHEDELKTALATCFRKIRKAYENDKRLEEPKVIAEEYMEGDIYSIDSYVNSRGTVYHLPMVRVKTGKDIGHHDFYGYTQMTPTILKRDTIKRAEAVAETAIHALGLRSSTAHTELMKIDGEFKVIELGPRMGGARDKLYNLSCNIDHPLNDVLIRIPKKPKIPKKCNGNAVYMKWFLPKEGIITSLAGIKKIEQLESFYKIEVNKKIGDRATFARSGGRSVFNLYLYNADRAKLLADIRRVEQLVKIKLR
ncbi:ATP-grasp domain-containing protein [Patescibacteria group bacterium]|nr:ATP-grasp domain-containing protein [Patescibacteria group bacterium]